MLQTTPHPIAQEYLTKAAQLELRAILREERYVRLPKLFHPDFFAQLRESAFAIEDAKTERHFIMPGCNTPRYMHTIGGSVIRRSSPFLMSLYEDMRLRSFLGAVTDSPIHDCTHSNEFMVMHFLENVGSTHGWHLDDPPFALVIVLEAPPTIAGGILEFIPRWKEYCTSTQIANCGDLTMTVDRLRRRGLVQQRHHAAGDAYILRADEALHRVTPFRWLIQRRAILNLAFQNTPSAPYGESASLLYDDNAHY